MNIVSGARKRVMVDAIKFCYLMIGKISSRECSYLTWVVNVNSSLLITTGYVKSELSENTASCRCNSSFSA
jgi:hypothetical protein